MQKIRCPRCGVVNLEKFVTFPSCAGCGSALPPAADPALPFWRRPLGAFLWVSVIGVAIAGLVAATSLLTPPVDNQAQIIIYGGVARRVALRQTIIVTMTVDTVGESNLQQRAPLHNAKLRLPRALFKKFAFVALDPKPDLVTSTKSGRYFHYDRLPRETSFRLRLNAVAKGKQSMRADFYADDHLPGTYVVSIAVSENRFLKKK